MSNKPILLSPGHPFLNFYRRQFYIAVPVFGIPVWHFSTVEHYFQSMKVFYMMPPHQHDLQAFWVDIATAQRPHDAKKMGNALPIDVELWNGARCGHMLEAMLAKFSQHSDLKEQLLVTDGCYLAEHSTNSIWGDGIDGNGLNLAGRCLMLARELMINGPE